MGMWMGRYVASHSVNRLLSLNIIIFYNIKMLKWPKRGVLI